jgi:2'-5' RNA ligase
MDRLPTFRAFVAISFTEDERAKIQSAIQPLHNTFPDKKIRWTKLEDFHITLQFLGYITQEQSQHLIKLISQHISVEQPIPIQTNGLIYLPHKNPKVLAISINKNKALMQLASLIHSQAKAAKIKLIEQTYWPHLTIGRFNQRPEKHLPIASLIQYTLPILTFHIRRFYLFKSITSPLSRYSQIQTFK